MHHEESIEPILTSQVANSPCPSHDPVSHACKYQTPGHGSLSHAPMTPIQNKKDPRQTAYRPDRLFDILKEVGQKCQRPAEPLFFYSSNWAMCVQTSTSHLTIYALGFVFNSVLSYIRFCQSASLIHTCRHPAGHPSYNSLSRFRRGSSATSFTLAAFSSVHRPRSATL